MTGLSSGLLNTATSGTRLREALRHALPGHLGTWLKWAALEAVAGFILVWLLAPGLPAWRYALALVVLPALFDCACRRVAWQCRRR